MKNRTIRLRLDELRIDPNRFQERKPIANGARRYGVAKKREADHVAELVKQLQSDREATLKNLKVWKDTYDNKYWLVDGFHRVEAYEEVWRPNRKINCEIIEAKDEHEARRIVFKDNSRAQLGFTQAERIEAAWQEVVRLERDGVAYSARKLGAQYKVSHDTIYHMRKAVDKIRDREGNKGRVPSYVSPWIVFRGEQEEIDTEGLIEAQQVGKLVSRLIEVAAPHKIGRQAEAIKVMAKRLSEIHRESNPEGHNVQIKVSYDDGTISDF